MGRGFGSRAAVCLDSAADQARAQSKRGQEAQQKSDSYRMAVDLQQRLCHRAVRFIARLEGQVEPSAALAQVSKVFARDHLMWLVAASHGFASQLMSKADVEEANRWARYIQTGSFEEGEDWFDPAGRYAIDGPTGVGKTVLAAAALAEVVSRYKAAGNQLMRGNRAALYCCSNIDLLVDCWNQLKGMGVDMSYVALICNDDERTPDHIPSPNRADALGCPVVLCTQQRITKLSTLHHRATGSEKARLRTTLQELLHFQEKDRFGIWDEAFHSADITALNSKALLSANSEIKIRGYVEEAIDRPDVASAAAYLKSICRQMSASRSGASRTTDALQRKGKQLESELVEASGFTWLAQQLGGDKQLGSQATLKQLAEISSAPLQVFSFPTVTGKKAQVQLVQPVARVDPMFKRVVVLDASYRIALLSASDRTIKASHRLNCADVLEGAERLIPKEFRDLHVTFCRGHSGRHRMEANAKNRFAMIRRQVSRIKQHVPPTERFLICSFKLPEPGELVGGKVFRDGKLVTPVDWFAEIKSELQAQEVPDWESRAEFVSWGMHRGRNCWRDIRYGFAIGLLSRAWDGDLHPHAKALEGDLIDAGKTVVANAQRDGALAEIAADLQQLIGRLHCRETEKVDGMNSGQSGETWFWVEMFEPHTRRPLQLETSALAQRLREVLPGIRLSTSGNPELYEEEEAKRKEREAAKAAAPPSAEEQFKTAALRWIAGLNGATINTRDLSAAVKEDPSCLELVKTVNEKTIRRGVAAAKAQVIRQGLYVAKTTRSLVAVR